MPRIFNQKRTKNRSIILEPILFVQKRIKNGSTLETKRLVERDWNKEEKIVELRKPEITTTGVKLIYQRQEKKVIIVFTV